MRWWQVSLFGMLLSAGAGQAQAFTGRIFLGFEGSTPAPNVRVTLSGLNPSRTDDQGVFRLALVPAMQPGRLLKLDIEPPPGWCVLSPFNGEIVMSHDRGETNPVAVRLLRWEFTSVAPVDCISGFIEAIVNESQIAASSNEPPQPLDLPRQLQEWAQLQNLAFTAQQARGELDRWLAAIKAQPRADLHLLGLTHFADKQFAQARQRFTQAAEQEEKQRGRVTERVVRDYRLAGDAATQEPNLEAALIAYKKAHERVSSTAQPKLWADILIALGTTHKLLGIQGPPERSSQHFAAAVSSYQQVLQVFTRARRPQDWAMMQHNLGLALRAQGALAAGAEGERLLGDSIQAFRQALQVDTQEQAPQQWVAAQHNLGLALQYQGERASAAESQRLLGEAVQVFRQALQVATRERQPQNWARIQNHLGTALMLQGERAARAERPQLFGESVQAYQQAMQVFTRDAQPEEWAQSQDDLGLALLSYGSWTTGAQSQSLFAEAAQAHRQAMQVFTRDARPKEWALMRLHLVRALQLQGERAEGAESETLLSEAMQVDEQALQVFTRDAYPKDWAHIQQSLGITLGLLGQRVAGAESQRLLNESAQAYRRAMLVFTRDALPEHWARTQNNLGNTLRMQGTRAAGAEGQKLLDEAVQSFRQAMQVYAREAQHEGWKMAQTNLGLTLLSQWQQAEKAERRRLLDEAVQVYRLLLEDSPDNPTFFGTLHDLYGSLGDFDKEYTLLASWLARHPEDLSSHANFAEAQLLTGRFAESVQSLAAILRNPEQASRHLALRTLEVVALTALGNSRDVPARLQSLRAAISAQPTPLKIRWRFAEVKVFLERDARLAAQRDWLLKLIAAVEKPDQAACLKALGIVIVQQPRAPPG